MFMGDSRGHWEGNSLVVETTNFTNKTSIGANGVGYNGEGGRHSEGLRLTERLSRVDPDTLNYQVTVDDPKTWTKPWTLLIPLKRDDRYQFLEYACHEGNYALVEHPPRRASRRGCSQQVVEQGLRARTASRMPLGPFVTS
jgi:hypothetical protein